MIKSYIIANKYQEQDVLRNLDKAGCVWADDEPLMSYMVSHDGTSFPYALNVRNKRVSITTPFLTHNVVFDGRTEPEPVKVSKEVMEDLKEHVEHYENEFVFLYDFSTYPWSVQTWLQEDRAERVKLLVDYIEGNRTLITPEQYVVRSDSKDSEGGYWYVRLDGNEHNKANVGYDIETATRFDTKEEAQSWANSHQEIVEV